MLVLVGVAGFSYAYGSTNPSIMGHDGNEILIQYNGESKSLQEVINGFSSSENSFGDLTDQAMNAQTSSLEKIQEGNVYTAQEDGFLIGVLVKGNDDTGSYSVVYADKIIENVAESESIKNSSSRKFLRGSASTYGYYYAIASSSFNIPIKKGEYFKIVYTKSGANADRYYSWMSLN